MYYIMSPKLWLNWKIQLFCPQKCDYARVMTVMSKRLQFKIIKMLIQQDTRYVTECVCDRNVKTDEVMSDS